MTKKPFEHIIFITTRFTTIRFFLTVAAAIDLQSLNEAFHAGQSTMNRKNCYFVQRRSWFGDWKRIKYASVSTSLSPDPKILRFGLVFGIWGVFSKLEIEIQRDSRKNWLGMCFAEQSERAAAFWYEIPPSFPPLAVPCEFQISCVHFDWDRETKA